MAVIPEGIPHFCGTCIKTAVYVGTNLSQNI